MSFGEKSGVLPQSAEPTAPSGREPKRRGKLTECEINRYYKKCIWANFTGTGWFCSMPVCWKDEVKKDDG